MMVSLALDKHLEQVLKPVYARRYHSMLEAVKQYLLPLGLTLPQPNAEVVGGYYI